MNLDVVRPDQLTETQLDQWRALQAEDPLFWSPCFSPEFTRCCAMARRDAYVAVMATPDGKPVFFPFHNNVVGIGRPIGGAMCDFTAVIGGQRAGLDGARLVRDCGMGVFDFRYMLKADPTFAALASRENSAPYLDLSCGLDAYVEERRRNGSDQIHDIQYAARRLEREVGELRYVTDERDPRMLRTLMDWKSGQYNATGANDLFAVPWARRLVQAVFATHAENFQGRLSTLYAGDTLIALHVGMVSNHVWHYWFPVYRKEFAKYSPGLILLLRMAEDAAGMGLARLDLGRGDELYKQRLASASIPLMEGSYSRPSLATWARGVRRCLGSMNRKAAAHA